MSISIKRARRSARRPASAGSANLQRRSTPIQIASASVVTTNLTVVFDQPVTLNGIPQYTTDIGSAAPVSAAMVNATTMLLVFNETIATATEVRIPYEEPAVRNSSGGFVATSVFSLV